MCTVQCYYTTITTTAGATAATTNASQNVYKYCTMYTTIRPSSSRMIIITTTTTTTTPAVAATTTTTVCGACGGGTGCGEGAPSAISNYQNNNMILGLSQELTAGRQKPTSYFYSIEYVLILLFLFNLLVMVLHVMIIR